MQTQELIKNLSSLRIQLHKSIVRKMHELGFCTSDKVVESFKRWYLWDFHNVETSRALIESQIKDAIKSLQLISKESAIKGITNKYTDYNYERELLRCSDGQVRNIYACGIHSLKLKKEALKQYVDKTLDRHVSNWDMTIEEAHQCIKRLEEWELKVIKERRQK